jgi:hypothetical protein
VVIVDLNGTSRVNKVYAGYWHWYGAQRRLLLDALSPTMRCWDSPLGPARLASVGPATPGPADENVAAVLVGEVATIIAAGLLLQGLAAELITALVRLVVSVLLRWPVQRLLLGDRVSWRKLLPGAVVAGTGQVLVLTISGLYLQRAIESQAQRYGLIGSAAVAAIGTGPFAPRPQTGAARTAR